MRSASSRRARPTFAWTGSRTYNPGWHLSRDLQYMLTVSEACARAALARKESRGAHSRLDYPKTEDAWGTKNHVIVKKDGEMKLFEVPRGRRCPKSCRRFWRKISRRRVETVVEAKEWRK